MKNGVQNETIIIRRRANNRIVIRHMIDGQLIGRAEVRKYVDYEDQFLVAATLAVVKLSKADALDNTRQDARHYPDTDPRSVKVGDTLYVSSGYRCKRSFAGKVVSIGDCTEKQMAKIIEPDGRSLWQWTDVLLGKIVPLGDINVGDEVLVADESRLGSTQKDYAEKIISIDRVDRQGDVWHESICFTPSLMLAGKLIRFQEANHA